MGGKQNGKKGEKYQPLDSNKMQREVNPGAQIPPTPVAPAVIPTSQGNGMTITMVATSVERPSNPFRIVGQARVSKSGMSLSIRLMDGLNFRFITVLRSDIVKLFTDNNNLSVCDVREYDNSNTNR